jgi:CRP/FNR family transcriptional activator FtrB
VKAAAPRRGEATPEDAFPGIGAATRAALTRHAVVHAVDAGTVLFEQGVMPHFQHVVLGGSVHLLGRKADGGEVLIEVVEPPGFVIPAAVVTDSPYLMRARVPEPSRLMLIEAEAFRALLRHDPQLAHVVIGGLAGQFRRLVRQIKNLKLRTTTERVGCYLLNLARRQGTPHKAVLPYEKNLVASELGMTRESFSRALAALQAEGIAVDGETISIADPKGLAAAVGLDPLIDGTENAAPLPQPPAAKPRGRGARG